MSNRHAYGAARDARPRASDDGSRVISFFIFNTDVHIHAYADDAPCDGWVERADAALGDCRDRCIFFERRLSRTREGSDISRAHAASPEPVEVALETAELIELARGYCARSGGLFDITMGTVTSLWDFHEGVVPSRMALADALPHRGMDKIRLIPARGEGAGRLPPKLSILDRRTILDVGGIAKGYIADDLGGRLIARGIRRFVINLGGNVLVGGGRPRRDGGGRDALAAAPAPWKIGIVNPRDPGHYRAIVDVADGSVVTSGLHERRFTRGGVSYHHILDPLTGMPAETDIASATIVSARSIDGDGLSTTALMMGAARAIPFIESIPGVEAVVIDERDEVSWTSGLGERLSLVPTLPRW